MDGKIPLMSVALGAAATATAYEAARSLEKPNPTPAARPNPEPAGKSTASKSSKAVAAGDREKAREYLDGAAKGYPDSSAARLSRDFIAENY